MEICCLTAALLLSGCAASPTPGGNEAAQTRQTLQGAPAEPEAQTPPEAEPNTPDAPDTPEDTTGAPAPGSEPAGEPEGQTPPEAEPNTPDAPDTPEDTDGEPAPGSEPVDEPDAQTPPEAEPNEPDAPDTPEDIVVEPAPDPEPVDQPEAAASLDAALACVDQDVQVLYAAIGDPVSASYEASCMGDGDDGILQYDGFIVFTYREPDGGAETVIDAEAN